MQVVAVLLSFVADVFGCSDLAFNCDDMFHVRGQW